ncbi:hypothetical protein E2C01_035884 [Portunus trituberculatus]|uniref:Uncharacterized protein n=1 Tax=Portunus trituberculatus TaxID=210409 RepID=A0A5B7F9N7_PORTR|nr:hypothetical protein [Portunus trituberculatus]
MNMKTRPGTEGIRETDRRTGQMREDYNGFETPCYIILRVY